MQNTAMKANVNENPTTLTNVVAMVELKKLLAENRHRVDAGDDGCYILGDGLEGWAQAGEPDFVLETTAQEFFWLVASTPTADLSRRWNG